MKLVFYSLVGLLLLLHSTAYCAGFDNECMGHQYGRLTHQSLAGLIQPITNSGTLLYGVDISQWQGTINWDNLKAATSFAIIRSSYGCPDPGETVAKYTDSKLSRNQSEARRVGILRGYYHFSYPDLNAPEPEADQFVNAIGTLQAGEILVLDFERNVSNAPAWCATFLERVHSKTGIWPFIYCGYSRLRSYNWSNIIADGVPLWLADWDGIADPSTPTTQWPHNTMKQYGDNGNVGGISPVDLDVFGGTSTQFMAYGGQAPSITTQPTNKSVPLGSTATFTVVASGTSPTYQWRRNGTNISGITSSTYTTGNPGNYSCVVSNSFGSVTSSTATLSISDATSVVTVAAAKKFNDGVVLALSVGSIVTRSFDGFFYVEDANRATGVRVIPSASNMLAEGSTATIYGMLQNISGERVITGALVNNVNSAAAPKILGMTCDSAVLSLEQGLLVKIWGVANVPKGAVNTFALEDGSNSTITVELHGVALPSNGAFVMVQGVLGQDPTGPLIRVNKTSDLR